MYIPKESQGPGRPRKDRTDNVVNNYLKKVSKYKLLSRDEEISLGWKIQLMIKIRKLRKEYSDKDIISILKFKDEKELKRVEMIGKRAHEKMFCANLRLVVFRAKRYTNKGLQLEDLIQEGNLGLHTACTRYNPDYGTKLSTYAVPWINHSIQLAIKKQHSVMYKPYKLNVEFAKIIEVTKELSRESDKPPTDLEVAKKLNIKPSRLRQIKILAQSTVSLDSKLDRLEEEGNNFLDYKYISSRYDPEEYVEGLLLKEQITKALDSLDEDEKNILTLRFGLEGVEPKTINEVSKVVKYTREVIRKIEHKAINKMRWQGYLTDFE